MQKPIYVLEALIWPILVILITYFSREKYNLNGYYTTFVFFASVILIFILQQIYEYIKIRRMQNEARKTNIQEYVKKGVKN